MAPLLSDVNVSVTPATMNQNSLVFSWFNYSQDYHFKNNLFNIVFYDISKTEIYRVNNITNDSYSLLDEEWNNLLLHDTSKFYFRIESYQICDNLITGPYISEYEEFYRPLEDNIIYLNNPIYLNGTKWIKFVAPSDGLYKFYSIGESNTIGYLFNNILYGNCENFCIIAGEDYDNLNFYIEYPLVNQEIYLKVNTDNELNNYQLNVELIEHFHNFSYMYENNDALSHKSYCTCGEYSIEQHNFHEFTNGYKCINSNYYTE